MSTNALELLAAQAYLGQIGQIGTKALSPVVANKITTTTNMKVGAYTIAAQPVTPARLSVTTVTVTGADTMGTITFVGTGIDGVALTETVIPIADGTVYTANEFKTVSSATGAGWVINTGNDTIVIGVAGNTAPTGMYFSALQVVTATVVASQTNKTNSLTASLANFASLPVGIYPCKVTDIALTSGTAFGILSRI